VTVIENPFRPGSGEEPPYFAGRHVIFHDVLLGLQRGPGGLEYHRLIVGGEGTGKSVLLRRIAAHARDEWRWTTVSWQGGTGGSFKQLLIDEKPRIEAELVAKTRRVPKPIVSDPTPASRAIHPNDLLGQTVISRLRQLGTLALEHGRTLLFVVDDLHALGPSDIAQLSGSLHTLANTEQLPIGLVAAGLSNTRSVIGAIPGTSFLEQRDPLRIGNLEPESTIEALQRPIESAGRTIARSALDHLASATEGYPHAIQLAGKYTWEAAVTGDEITLGDARSGAKQTVADMAKYVYEPRWSELVIAERRYLRVAARLVDADGEISTGDIAGQLGLKHSQLSPVRADLIDRRLILRPTRYGKVVFDTPGFARWITEDSGEES
jgi:type II secretory pathway predicted ATPase ExeA